MCKNAQDYAKDIKTALYYSIKKNINHKACLPGALVISSGPFNEYLGLEYPV